MISIYSFPMQTWTNHSTAIHSVITQEVGWVDMSVKGVTAESTEVFFTCAPAVDAPDNVEGMKDLIEIQVDGETIPMVWVEDVLGEVEQ